MNPRIQHVSIPMPVDEETTARAFYGDLLGLHELVPPPAVADLREIWFQLGDTELHLFEEEEIFADRTARHFCIAVDDVEMLRAQLEAKGITVVGSMPIPGRPRYFCRDPFGNLIEFTTIEDHD